MIAGSCAILVKVDQAPAEGSNSSSLLATRREDETQTEEVSLGTPVPTPLEQLQLGHEPLGLPLAPLGSERLGDGCLVMAQTPGEPHKLRNTRLFRFLSPRVQVSNAVLTDEPAQALNQEIQHCRVGTDRTQLSPVGLLL
jgi:hypothetical protein